jgi:ribosomal protein S18 acetylase RimI-like enzyme
MTADDALIASPDPVTRFAQPADAKLVHMMVLEIAEHEGSRAAVEATAEDWSRLLTDARVTVLVAFAGTAPVGYVSAVRHLHLWTGSETLALDDLYVRPTARNRGIGEQLMAALAAHATAAGVTLLRWEMEESNVDAQRFYLRLGASLRRKVIATWTLQQPVHNHGTAGAAR